MGDNVGRMTGLTSGLWERKLGNIIKISRIQKVGGLMLILTRRVGESLKVGDEITITVLGVKGSQVRIGVNAPKDVSVHREEIYERIKKEQGDAELPAAG